MSQKLTTETFLERAIKVHGDKYDYSKVIFVDRKTNVCVICKKHGDFYVNPKKLLLGRGCLKCAKDTVWDYDACYNEAKKYNSETKFKTGSQRAYGIACRNGWINDYDWFEVLWSPFWDYENCMEEAKKYKSKTDFKNACPSGYSAARLHNWLNEYDWFEIKSRPNNFWQLEQCLEEAKKYSTRTEFQKKAPGAYNSMQKNGWLDKLYFLGVQKKENGYWNKETCEQEARKYKTRGDFAKGSITAYNRSLRNGWIEEYTWLEFKRKPNSFWTRELCEIEASKYDSKKEFLKGNPAAHAAAVRNGWLNSFSFTNSERFLLDGKIDSVYAYIFKQQNAVYVGRTLMRRQKRRDKEHLFNDNNDAVASFAFNNHCEVPLMTILEENLTLIEGQDREDYWRKHFESLGYTILNKAATGKGKGSLGTINNGKWNKQTCYEEAQKYIFLRDFSSQSPGAYDLSRASGWLEGYTWLKRLWRPIWDKEGCFKEAKKYLTLHDFIQKSNSAYTRAKREGWLIDYDWLEMPSRHPNGYWNIYENCYYEAKKYKKRAQFQKGSVAAYTNALKNGWIDDYVWFEEKQKHNYWNKTTCFDEAKKYNKVSYFARHAVAAYNMARSHGWLKDYTWFEKQFEWTYDLCKNEASKYTTRGQFKAGCTGAYQKSRKMGWLDDFFLANKIG